MMSISHALAWNLGRVWSALLERTLGVAMGWPIETVEPQQPHKPLQPAGHFLSLIPTMKGKVVGLALQRAGWQSWNQVFKIRKIYHVISMFLVKVE